MQKCLIGAPNEKYILIRSDFNDLKDDFQDINIIITDPPYSKKYLGLYEDLAAFGKKVLKPGGSLLAMAGVLENKFNTLMPYLLRTAKGDEDLIREGAIGILESMEKVPCVANKYHATKAKWSIFAAAELSAGAWTSTIGMSGNPRLPLSTKIPYQTPPTPTSRKPCLPIKTVCP